MDYKQALQAREAEQARVREIIARCRRQVPPVPLRRIGLLLLQRGHLPPRGGLEWSTSHLHKLCVSLDAEEG